MPYWVPLIPPMGISCLKSYLAAHGIEVKTVMPCGTPVPGVIDRYFDLLKKVYTPGKTGKYL